MSDGHRRESEPATGERVARNDAIFRDANEGIRQAAEEHGVLDRPVPFVCECADPACRQLLRLTVAEYEEVREDPTRFLHAPGHVQGDDLEQVVAELDGYVVVQKRGGARAALRRLPPGGSDLAEPREDKLAG